MNVSLAYARVSTEDRLPQIQQVLPTSTFDDGCLSFSVLACVRVCVCLHVRVPLESVPDPCFRCLYMCVCARACVCVRVHACERACLSRPLRRSPKHCAGHVLHFLGTACSMVPSTCRNLQVCSHSSLPSLFFAPAFIIHADGHMYCVGHQV